MIDNSYKLFKVYISRTKYKFSNDYKLDLDY